MGSTHNRWPYIINLGNSIIGVSMLAMPYCFQKCGIILSVVVLVLCTWLTLISCNLLMKAGVTCRRRSYEFLAYHTHGAPGKFISEIGMIGFQLGTLIAQIVVVGDLGPSIVTKIFGIQNSSGLRTFLMVVLCMSVGLPMALIRDIRSVSRVSAVCVAFYCTFVVYVIWLAVPNLWYGDWYEKVYFWRPEGFFQCLPILSFSFGCQTQLFLLYDALPEPSLKAMSSVVNSAVSLCAVAYLMVGFCGYISFYTHDIPGDVIGVFPNVFFTDVMKICFVFSIVITFPVMVFPCRASIYTLLFAKKSKARDEMIELDTHMPARQLKIITFSLVVGSMIIAILIPNVEFILGMNGAVMGTLICYIFPALFFLKVMGSKPEGKNLAQLVLFLGLTILLVSTYSTLRSQDKVSTHIDEQAQVPLQPVDANLDNVLLPKSLDIEKIKIKDIETASKQPGDRNSAEVVGDMRKEPPNPHPPDIGKPVEGLKSDHQNDIKRDKIDKGNNSAKEIVVGDSDKLAEAGKENVKLAEANKAKELELQEKEKKQGELLAELEKQRDEQKILIEEQRQLLKEFKDHHDKDMKQEAQQQVVAQNQENAVNQPLPQSPSLQPVVIQQQNGQEPVVRPQQSLNNQPDNPSQQLHLLQVNETSHIDNANQQQVMPKGEQKAGQVNIVDTLNGNVKPQDRFVDANVDRQELHPVHEQSSDSQTVRQEVLHLVPVEPPVIFQQSTQFGSQKEHEMKEQHQNQLLQKQETSQDSYKQQPQFELPQIQSQVVQLELKPHQSQVPQLEPQISQQGQPQPVPQEQNKQAPGGQNQQPQISQQGQPHAVPQEQNKQAPGGQNQQPQISQQGQPQAVPQEQNKQAPGGQNLQPQIPQQEQKQPQENIPQKAPNLDVFIRQKRDVSAQSSSLVNETEISQSEENYNSSLYNDAPQQKDKSKVTSKLNMSIVEEGVYVTSTEKVSEKLSNADIPQGVENDNGKPRTNEEMRRRKLRSFD